MGYVAEPQWLSFPAVGQAPGNLEEALTDIVSHLADQRTYRDSRHITWAHETTHGINAAVRNQKITLFAITAQGFVLENVDGGPLPQNVGFIRHRLPRPAGVLNPELKLGNVNGVYVLKDRAFRLPEPSMTLAQVAEAIPQELRGMSYQLYLVQQRQYWNDSPLYVMDEWASYLNGLTTGIEGGGKEVSYSDVLQPVEFMGYAWAMLEETAAKGYQDQYRLRDLTAYQTARTYQLLARAAEAGLQTSQAASHKDKVQASMGKVMECWCGLSWCQQVWEGKDFYGVF